MNKPTSYQAKLVQIRTEMDTYDRLERACREGYRDRLVEADPRLDRQAAFHLAHNWGNGASRALLDQFHQTSTYLSRRRVRRYQILMAELRTL